jgi:replicative DNA helicase
VIDYLQLMRAETGNNNSGNRQEEISTISRSLKNLAKELDIPVIALSQLSREVEKQGTTKRPQLSHLRESGAIEQDADMVIFLYRPEYYGLTEDEEGHSTAGVGEVIIAKNRHGGTETVKLTFVGSYTKFTEPISNFAASGGFGGSFASSGTSFPTTSTIPSDFSRPATRPSQIIPSKLNNPSPSADDSLDVPF